MSKIRCTVREGDMREFLTGKSGPVYRHVEELGAQVEVASKRFAPSKDGHLRSSIMHVESVRGSTVVSTIGSHLPYAIFQHEGTGIYGPRHSYIYPVHGKYLVFTPGSSSGTWGQASSGSGGEATAAGGKVFARKVRGVPSNPFLYLGLKQVCKGWPVRRIPWNG